ncbi:acyl-CoA reductase [Leeuwenhoekiella sp. W20_SRS_FM14]|uniref:acyl-CoA reductase n=1 Tax=Leeuwenhoekiella sp. W20_SRS_FM14 TaxID=3240270 RepID=UPI003F9DE602
MDLNQRITAFSKLGLFLNDFLSNTTKSDMTLADTQTLQIEFAEVLKTATRENAWFTPEHLQMALSSWSESLTETSLKNWTSAYNFDTNLESKRVAVIMAGNLPLVGFHDFLSVLISGHSVLAKLSSDDKLILPYLAKVLIAIEPLFENKIEFTEGKLAAFDAVIATGSNNTARYFEYYFKTKPHIIRKNRNAVAVLTGNESTEELELLGDDIFRYFGMGCRSVSKLFVPQDYNFDFFYKAMFNYKDLLNHHKYANNYDYNKAVYLMSLFPILDNGFLVLKEEENFSSPISVVFYERYDNLETLKTYLDEKTDQIQCIVASGFDQKEVGFGQAQKPNLSDYADGVDTIAFLLKI